VVVVAVAVVVVAAALETIRKDVLTCVSGISGDWLAKRIVVASC